MEATELGLKDLKKVRAFLFAVRAKWYDIGVELEVDPGTLGSIKLQYPDPKDCLTEVVKTRLKSHPPTTWKTLADALKGPVGEVALADQALAQDPAYALMPSSAQSQSASARLFPDDGSQQPSPTPQPPVTIVAAVSHNEPSLRSLHQLKWRDDLGVEQVFRLGDRVSSKWTDIGILLDMEYDTLTGMKTKHLGDSTKCWNEVMSVWLSGCSWYYPPTWEGLYSLLRDLQHAKTALDLEKAVRRAI